MNSLINEKERSKVIRDKSFMICNKSTVIHG